MESSYLHEAGRAGRAQTDAAEEAEGRIQRYPLGMKGRARGGDSASAFALGSASVPDFASAPLLRSQSGRLLIPSGVRGGSM